MADDYLAPTGAVDVSRLPTATSEPAGPDAKFDQVAALTARLLHVPVALVSLVDQDKQVFPGAVGLPQPWQDQRTTPLTHSFCQYVVDRAAPLVVPDATADPLFADSPAIRDLSVIAYAGMPLTDLAGRVVGSLCAIDSERREWTDAELANLRDLASICSAEVALRAATRQTTLLAERDRIARGLQQQVIGRLLELVMQLGAIRSQTSGALAERVEDAARSAELALITLRGTVFDDEHRSDRPSD